MPDKEEKRKIRESIMFPFLLYVIDRDKQIIAHSPLKLKDTYEQVFEHVSNRVFKDMVASYDQLKAMKVKIYEQKRELDGLRIHYIWRGYHNDTFYRWIDMKEDIKQKIRYYFGDESLSYRKP